MSKQCKRVLQIIRTMNIGGAETLIMNIYRNIDRNQIQFDFLVNGEGKYDDEIRQLGGRIYLIPYLTEVGQFKYVKELKDFFKEHPEYTTIHSHIDQVSGIIVETAKKSGVPVVISHSHNTQNSNNMLGKIYKSYLQSKINKNTRSEEHTSELQSRPNISYAVACLKKKKHHTILNTLITQ